MYEFLTKLFKEVDGKPEALTAEQLVQRIQAEKNLKIVNLEDGGYVAKEKLDAKITELNGVKQQLTDANTTIQSYKDMDIEGIQKSAKEWETKYNTETKALNDRLAAQERAHQTDRFLDGYKFTSKAARAGIRSEFEAKKFKLEDGVFQGAADYMKSLMADDDYKGAFVPVEKPDDKPADEGQKKFPQFARGTNGGKAGASGSQTPVMNFGFTRLREPANKE